MGKTTRSQPEPGAAQKERQPRKIPRGHFSNTPFDGGQRWVLERKIEQLKEVEQFLIEGLELGLTRYAVELKRDIELLRLKLSGSKGP